VTALCTRRLLVALVAAAALVGLLAAGRGPIGTPPTGSWSEVEAWYELAGPVPATMQLVRGLAVAGAVWILFASVLQLLASLRVGRSLARVADAVSPRLLQQAAHLSIAAGLAVPSAAGTPPPSDPPGTAVMEVLEAGEDDVSTTTTAPAAITVPPTTAPPTTAPATSTTTSPGAPPDPRPPVAPPAPVAADPVGEEIVVLAGDSFWSIAADVLAEARGRGVTDREVQEYWRRLIHANRARLVEPGNPDLLLPHQRLVRPQPLT